ncbi:MAG: DUF5666 domain-containing protein, partial [Chloroflexota bacterium]
PPAPAGHGLDAATSGIADARTTLYAPVVDPSTDQSAGAPLDRGPRGGGLFRDITIGSISGSSVTLRTDDGWSRTITVTSSVTITKGGQDASLADLKVGDQIRFAQTRNDDGTYTVTAIAVVVPSVAGSVSDVTTDGFKVTTRDGSVWTITTTSSTAYKIGVGDGTRADLVAGAMARVLGTSAGDSQLAALTVQVAADRVVGTVTAKTASTITVRTPDGTSRTINVGSTTTYVVAGTENATLADITVDMVVAVQGRTQADGSVNATAVLTGRGMGRGFGPGLGRGEFGPGSIFDTDLSSSS